MSLLRVLPVLMIYASVHFFKQVLNLLFLSAFIELISFERGSYRKRLKQNKIDYEKEQKIHINFRSDIMRYTILFVPKLDQKSN